jgi:hypothetical protein
MAKTCDFPGCGKPAVGGFEETEDAAGFTTSGSIRISETYWCEQHKDDLSGHFFDKNGNFVSV